MNNMIEYKDRLPQTAQGFKQDIPEMDHRQLSGQVQGTQTGQPK